MVLFWLFWFILGLLFALFVISLFSKWVFDNNISAFYLLVSGGRGFAAVSGMVRGFAG